MFKVSVDSIFGCLPDSALSRKPLKARLLLNVTLNQKAGWFNCKSINFSIKHELYSPEVLVCAHLVLVHDQLNRRIPRLRSKPVSWFHVSLTHRVGSSTAESSRSVHPVPNQENEPEKGDLVLP